MDDGENVIHFWAVGRETRRERKKGEYGLRDTMPKGKSKVWVRRIAK